MIYPINYVEEHPAYKIHEAVSWFINEMDTLDVFTTDIFEDEYPEMIDILASSDRLTELLNNLLASYNGLANDEEKAKVKASFTYWNDIHTVCHNCHEEFVLWDDLHENIRIPLMVLYDFLYNTLTKSSAALEAAGMLRVQHYRDYWKLNGKVCTYCGIRELDDPDVQLNAYDHYLHITKYPFCSVNYRNIVPICDKCNEAPAKGAKHVLFSDYANRQRRQAFFPYEEFTPPTIDISIDTIFPGDCNITLDVHGDSAEKISTWMEVFYIHARYKSAIRTERKTWINNLLKHSKTPLDSLEALKNEIQDHLRDLKKSSRYLYQHLEIAFWYAILEKDIEIELLLDYINNERVLRYAV